LVSTVWSQELKVKLALLEDLTAKHCCFRIILLVHHTLRSHRKLLVCIPVESFFKSGVTSPNRTTANCFTSSTCFQKVDFFIGPTGTKRTRIRQTDVMLMANSILLKRLSECSSVDVPDQNVRLELSESAFKIQGKWVLPAKTSFRSHCLHF
jgi:hypothetical protein